MEKTVTIKLPLTRSEKEDVFVGINGRSWLLQRGIEVEVSRWSSLSATRGFSDPAEWAGTETSAVYGRK